MRRPTADTRLLVEPVTGAIVSLDDVDQTISAIPDVSGLAGLATTLTKPQYADDAVVQGTLAALKRLPTDTRTEVLRMQYAQTPASVAIIADYADGKASDVRLVKTLVPLGLTILGAVALLGAVAIVTARGRTRTTA